METTKEEPSLSSLSSPSPSLLQIFRYADRMDRVLLLLGTASSIVAGMVIPLTFLVTGRTINALGEAGASLSSSSLDKVSFSSLPVDCRDALL